MFTGYKDDSKFLLYPKTATNSRGDADIGISKFMCSSDFNTFLSHSSHYNLFLKYSDQRSYPE